MKCTRCKFYNICKGRLNETVENCVRFKSVEQTNEEWFCFLTTEEKAKFIFKQHFDIYQNEKSLWNLMVASAKGVPRADQVDAMIKAVEEWLQKPHEVE